MRAYIERCKRQQRKDIEGHDEATAVCMERARRFRETGEHELASQELGFAAMWSMSKPGWFYWPWELRE